MCLYSIFYWWTSILTSNNLLFLKAEKILKLNQNKTLGETFWVEICVSIYPLSICSPLNTSGAVFTSHKILVFHYVYKWHNKILYRFLSREGSAGSGPRDLGELRTSNGFFWNDKIKSYSTIWRQTFVCWFRTQFSFRKRIVLSIWPILLLVKINTIW